MMLGRTVQEAQRAEALEYKRSNDFKKISLILYIHIIIQGEI